MQRILAIDDDIAFLDLIQDLLKQNGYEVATCHNPIEALSRIHESSIQCILLDIHMPQMDGMDLLHLIHSQKPEIPIIICTGELEAPKTYFLREGAAQFLKKPIDHNSLVDVIHKVLVQGDELTPVWIKGYNLKNSREELFRKLIIKALSRTHFNVTQAAALLGVTRQCLLRYMKTFQIKHE